MARRVPVLALLFWCSSASASSFSIGASFSWHRTEERASTAALLVIELPLERFAAPRTPRLTPRRLLEDASASGSGAPAPMVREEERPALRKPLKPSASGRDLLQAKLARRVVQAALRARGSAKAGERLDGLASRSRTAAALPELTLRALRSNDQSLRLSPTTASAYDYTQTGGAGLLFEARAVWRLDRLVFADEELRVERLRAEQLRVSERLVADVLKYLFTLQRARAQLEADDLLPEEALRAELEAAEAAAALDVLTDGAFAELERGLIPPAEKPTSAAQSADKPVVVGRASDKPTGAGPTDKPHSAAAGELKTSKP